MNLSGWSAYEAETCRARKLTRYMALYRQRAPSGMTPPSFVHPTVRENIDAIVDFIWRDLQEVTNASGESRVF